MPGANLTTVNNILKELYLGPVNRQLNDELFLLSVIDVSQEEIVGKYAVVPLSYGRTGGIGARAESGALPDPGNQSFDQAQYNIKYLYSRIRITGPSMAKTSSEAGSFMRILKAEVDGVTRDTKKDLVRQLYNDGTGVVATITTGSSTTVINLTSPEAIDKGQIYPGMYIDVGSLATPTNRTGAFVAGAWCTVSDVDPTGNGGLGTVTVSVALSGAPSAGEFIFRQGNNLASSVTNDISGLQQVVTTSAGGTFGGINSGAAGKKYWDNQRATTATITQDAMQQLWNRVRRGSGMEPNYALSTYGARRQFFNTLQPQVRFQDAMNLKGGFNALQFNGLPFVADHEAPYGKLYLLNTKQLRFFSINSVGGKDWAFLDQDGDMLKWRSGFDEWEAVLHRYCQLGAEMRSCNGVLSGFTDNGY